jgi:uncharacterized phiE125 gp8 family phage protein
MTPKIITQPDEEPFTIDECRAHLAVEPYEVDTDGVGTHPHDDMIMGLQAAAREYCEGFLGLSLAPKTYEIALDEFPDAEIELPMPPQLEIVSVKYLDADQVEQTMAESDYSLDSYQKPGWLLPAAETTWPATGAFVNAVKIRYTAGYGHDSDSEPLPKAIGAAIKLVLGHLYKNRESSAERALAGIPLGVESLLRPHRIRLGMA